MHVLTKIQLTAEQLESHPDYYTIKYFFPDIKDQYLQGKRNSHYATDTPDLVYNNTLLGLKFNISKLVHKFTDTRDGTACPVTTSGAVHPAGFPLMGVEQHGRVRMINTRRVIAMVYTDMPLKGIEVNSLCRQGRCCSFEHIGFTESTQRTN
jgi:hypothetical protein